MHQLEVNMATNDRVIALGSRALLAVVSLLGASLGGAAAVPGNNTSVSGGRSTLGVVAAATRTKVAEQKIKTNTKLKTTGRLAPGTTNTLNRSRCLQERHLNCTRVRRVPNPGSKPMQHSAP